MKFSEMPTHLFFDNKQQLLTDPLKLLELAYLRWDDIKKVHDPLIDRVRLAINTLNPIYQDPNAKQVNREFIDQLTILDNRLKVSFVAPQANKKVLMINFARLDIIHFQKYGYYASNIATALKARRRGVDTMDWVITSSLDRKKTNILKSKVEVEPLTLFGNKNYF